jgi:hypothetical protein
MPIAHRIAATRNQRQLVRLLYPLCVACGRALAVPIFSIHNQPIQNICIHMYIDTLAYVHTIVDCMHEQYDWHAEILRCTFFAIT